MAEHADYLTQQERELVTRRAEFETATAIQGLAQLAARLSGDLSDDAERIRSADPELAKKIGRKTAQILALIEALPTRSSVDETEVKPMTFEAEIITPVETSLDNQLDAAEVAQVVIAKPEQAIPELEISEDGIRWLVRSFSTNWKNILEVSPTDTIESISERIAAMVPVRAPNSLEKAATRISGRLKGLSTQEIADLIPDDTKGAAQVYLSLTAKRLSFLHPEPLRSVSLNKTAPVILETEVEANTQGLAEDEEIDTREAERLEQEPKHVQLSVLIGEKLTFTESQQLALQSFLDPSSSGTLSDQKREIVELVRQEIRNKIDLESLDLTDAERRWVRTGFGVYTAFNQPKDVEPLTLHDMIKSGRTPSQKNEIPVFVYNGLDKLFADVVETAEVEVVEVEQPAVLSLDDFVRAAVEPEMLTKEAYEHYRAEVEKELVESGNFSTGQVAVLMKRSRYGQNAEHQQVNGMLKSAMTKLMRKVVQNGGVNSGNPIIDSSFKKFIFPNFVTSNLDAIKANLPQQMQDDPEIVERVILAGMYSVYASNEQQVA